MTTWLERVEELPVHSAVQRRNMVYLRTKASEYPFGAYTTAAGRLRPEWLDHRMPRVHFIRVPFMKAGYILWVFTTKADRDTFVRLVDSTFGRGAAHGL